MNLVNQNRSVMNSPSFVSSKLMEPETVSSDISGRMMSDDEEQPSSELSQAVERILMAVEARQKSRLSKSQIFENTPTNVLASKSNNSSVRQCHQHQESLCRGIHCHGGDLTEAEVSQLIMLCASLTTLDNNYQDMRENNNINNKIKITPDSITCSFLTNKSLKLGWKSVDNDAMSALIPLLEKHVNSAACVDIIGEFRSLLEEASCKHSDCIEQWLDPSQSHRFSSNNNNFIDSSDFSGLGHHRISVLRRGLESSSILLSMMVTPGIDKKHISDDSINSCVSLMRMHLNRNIIPALSATGHTATSKVSFDNSPLKKKSKKKNDTILNQKELIKYMKKVYKPVLSTVGILSLLMERVDILVQNIHVDDQPLMSICSASLGSLAIDAASPTQSTSNNAALAHIIQVASMGLVSTIFRKYPRHRMIILEDIFPLMLRLPTAKRSLRTYPIKISYNLSKKKTNRTDSQSMFVQNITALILCLVQGCVTMPQATSSTTENDSSLPRLSSGLSGSRNVCDYFTSQMIQRCSKRGEEGGASEFRPILAHLVEDLLVVQLLPEYPGADLLLLTICHQLTADLLKTSSSFGKKRTNTIVNTETTYISTAMDTLGTICSDIANKLCIHRENPLKLPKAVKLDNLSKNEEINANRCFCGRNSFVDTFMLDCDRCHGWFHGSCVGVRKDNLPEIWICDECTLQLIVYEQTKSLHSRYNRKMKSVSGNLNTFEIEESYIMRQLLLNYLSHLSESTRANNVEVARKFHLAKWIEEFEKRRDDVDQKSHLNVLEVELMCSHFLEQWNLIGDGRKIPFEDSDTKEDIAKSTSNKFQTQSLSNYGNGKVTLSLATIKSDLVLAFPRILGVLIKLMDVQEIVSFRKLAVKSIFQVIQVDSSLMLQPVVRDAVSCRFRDEAISVREVAVNLVGTYVLHTPESANIFHTPLLLRLHDKGVSVRKRTVKIFRDILISYPSYNGRAEACTVMLQRAADPKEDDGVRDLIQDLFLSLWFDVGTGLNQNSTPRHITLPQAVKEITIKKVDSSNGEVNSKNSPNGQARKSRGRKKEGIALAEEQRQIRCDAAAKQMVDVVEISKNPSYLTKLVKDLLFGLGEGDKASKAAERKRRQNVAQKYCSSIVSSLMELLLAFEERRINSEEKESGVRLIAIVSTLVVFAEASPVLLLQHLDALLSYLKADNGVTREQEASIVSAVSNIISRVTDIMLPSDVQRLSFITDDLVKITYNFGSCAVNASIEALSKLSWHKETGEQNMHRTKLMKLAKTFYSYLNKMAKTTDDFSRAKVSIKNNVHRALSILGSICRYQKCEATSLEDYSHKDTLSWFNLPNACYKLFHVFLCKLDVQTQCQAIRAMSGIFTAHPRILLAVEQTGIIAKVMSETSHPDLQLEALRSWVDILISEELRIESGEALRQMESRRELSLSKKISGDQDSDSSLIGGVMTQHSSRLYEMSSDLNPKIRFCSVQLIEHLLRQGLLNPMEAVPHLLAAQGDINNQDLRSLALKLVIKEGEKRPDMLRQRICEGIKRAYLFQKKVYPSIDRITALVPNYTNEDLNQEQCIFGPIFKESKQSRMQRNGLFRSLLNLFSGNNNVTLENFDESSFKIDAAPKRMMPKRKAKDNTFTYLEQLPLLSFASEILAFLPYQNSGDILFIAYQIQCILSLEVNLLFEKFSSFLPKELRSKNCIDKYDTVDTEAIDPIELAASTSATPSKVKEISAILKKSFDVNKFAELCAHASSLVLLLRLKKYLVQKYGITLRRIADYVPNQKEKIVDRGINSPDYRITFDAVIEESRTKKDISLDPLIRQYAEFHRLHREDERISHIQSDDDNFNDVAASGKKRKKSSFKGVETLADNGHCSDESSLVDQDEESSVEE